MHRPQQTTPQQGFSLVELLVSMALGLLLIVALLAALEAAGEGLRSNDRSSELGQAGYIALSSLKEELRQAGFLGLARAGPNVADAPAPWIEPTSGCAEAGGTPGDFVANIAQGIWGADSANPFAGPHSCLASGNYVAGTDVLVLRRLSSSPEDTLVANTVYFQSSYGRGHLLRGSTEAITPVQAGAALPAAIYAVKTYVYFVSPFSASAAESPRVPALWRLALQADGSMARELVASGVERMQLQYGVASPQGEMQFHDGLPGAASVGQSKDPLPGWPNVSAVRLWLLLRSATPEPGYVNSQTYTMGNQPYTVNDGFRRQLLSTVVQLRNGG
jgi:type IV pilus assembly protein PilW